MEPTQKQALYLRDLLEEAGYTGNPVVARNQAAADLLGWGEIHWDRDQFSQLIDALKIDSKPAAPISRQVRAEQRRDQHEDAPIVHRTGNGTAYLEY